MENSPNPGNLPHPTEFFDLYPDEKILRAYHCAALIFPKCDGYLYVTDSRMVVCGIGTGSKVVHQAPLELAEGVNSHFGSKFNLAYLKTFMWALLFTLVFIAIPIDLVEAFLKGARYTSFFRISTDHYILFFIMSALALLMLKIDKWLFQLIWQATYSLKIFSSMGGSLVSIGEGGELFDPEKQGALFGRPGDDATLISRELGVVLHLIKTERWDELEEKYPPPEGKAWVEFNESRTFQKVKDKTSEVVDYATSKVEDFKGKATESWDKVQADLREMQKAAQKERDKSRVDFEEDEDEIAEKPQRRRSMAARVGVEQEDTSKSEKADEWEEEE